MDEKEVRWSLKAIHDKISILDYWISRNKSKTYSQKLDVLFNKAIESTAKNPFSGKKTGYRNIRIKVVRHFLIFYLIQESYIQIVRIWDTRRNPKKFDLE